MLRRLSEQNYYQVLEISYDASPKEIQSAYEAAREMYDHEALVSGSILSDHERRRTFDRIFEAYQTLIAEESRRLYDRRLGLVAHRLRGEGRAAPSAAIAGRTLAFMTPQSVDVEISIDSSAERTAVERRHATPSSLPAVRTEPRECPFQLKSSEEATGAFLKKVRESMGLELSAVSEETKIGRAVLEYIESERIDRLPPVVYLRSFTRQVARFLGLDEDRVSRTYIARVQRLSD